LGGAQLLVFLVGSERYAVELKGVDEIVESPVVRPMPEVGKGLLGVFSLREQLLPLYAAGSVLNPTTREGRFALVMRGGVRRIGLLVDDVEDVIEIMLSELRDPPPGVNDDEVVAGLVWKEGRLMTVLDTRALVAASAGAAAPSAA
jgi:purine-binding chemotaxis protein CheW